jgi:hypothetical protein
MKKKFLLFLLAAAFLLISQPFNSFAIPITGGETTVEITDFTDLFGLGIIPIPIPDAQLVDFDFGTFVPTVSFPITGGDTEPLSIEHEGSGVLLQSLLNPYPNLFVGNFVIDGVGGQLFAEAFSGGSLGEIALFDIGDANSDGLLPLNYTPDAAQAIVAIFGLNLDPKLLAGEQFGLAQTDPQTAPVPEPSTIVLIGISLFGLAGFSRKKFKK